MIKYDEKLLAQRLLDVIKDQFNFPAPYLVLENIGFLMYLSEQNSEADYQSYELEITGRFGDSTNPEKEKHFEMLINSSWSYDFIKGYFCRHIQDL